MLPPLNDDQEQDLPPDWIREEVLLHPDLPWLIIGNQQEKVGRLGEADVLNLNEEIVDSLRKLARHVAKDGLILSAEKRDEYLSAIRDTGARAYGNYFSPDARRAIEDLSGEEALKGISLTIQTPPTHALVWECLYCGGPGAQTIDPARFWGFKYSLGRTHWEIRRQAAFTLKSGVFAVGHSTLPSSQAELCEIEDQLLALGEFLGARLSLSSLDVAPLEDSASIQAILEYLSAPQFGFGILHFSCHGHNSHVDNGMKASLKFTFRASPRLLQVQDLYDHILRGNGFRCKPLIFLNACDTATLNHFLEVVGFPHAMLSMGAASVIATACPVPDNFARAFAAEFFRKLLYNDERVQYGRYEVDVAETLLETRRHFLDAPYNNPLGLAYGLHGQAGQMLQLTRRQRRPG